MNQLERAAFEKSRESSGLRIVQESRRLAAIAKYYRWDQLARRAGKIVVARLNKNARIKPAAAHFDLALAEQPAARELGKIIVAGLAHRANETATSLQQGVIQRLNQSVEIGWPVDWPASQTQSHLWRFQLHYHEYLLPLAADSLTDDLEVAVPSPEKKSLIWDVIESWLDHYSPEKTLRRDDAWHPYCISRRLPVWIWLISLHSPPAGLLERMRVSMFQQAEYLRSNLEKDLGGNHLLENLTALALAAFVLKSPRSERWLATVDRELMRELKRQILPHGEHYELSPMYHCQILSNLLKMAALGKSVAPELAEMCLTAAEPMLSFLRETLHPDGEIALLGDSGFGEAPSVAEIHSLAELNGLHLLGPRQTNSSREVEAPAETNCLVMRTTEIGPYWVHRGEVNAAADFVIFDRGETAADHLPAHGHCDLLTFEASVGGRRWFVDSGNFNYEDDSMRAYCRSSLSHNVATVESKNQSDIWSKFRMGDRASILTRDAGSQGGFEWATGSSNAYRKLGVQNSQRIFAVSNSEPFWICADHFRFKKNSKARPLLGYLHLAPAVQVTPLEIPGSTAFRLNDGNSQRDIIFFNVSEAKIIEGWYCPEFGLRIENQVFVYTCASPQQPFGWVLQGVKQPVPRISTSENSFSVSRPDSTISFNWSF